MNVRPDGLNRRSFIRVSTGAGLGLVLSFYLPSRRGLAKSKPLTSEIFMPNAFLRIDKNSKVTLMLTLPDVGTGVHTSLPMVLAEQLEVDWSSITFENADYDRKYGSQDIGGSSSVSDNFGPLSKAGAAAREMLIAAAARIWSVAPETCRAEIGRVIHQPSGRRLAYGDLVETAAQMPVPANPRLKDSKSYTIIGKSLICVDTPEKVSGKAIFGIDTRVPGMVYAVIARCPVFGGKAKSFDAAEARKIDGVRDVLMVGDNVVVLADNTWSAIQGRNLLKVEWDEGKSVNENSTALTKLFEEAAAKPGKAIRLEGDVEAALATADRKLEASYQTPFLAHAPMEPPNCTAKVTSDGCEVWVANQIPSWAQPELANALRLPPSSIKLHIPLMGGSFGRRINPDYVVEAALISKAANAPVKLVWTREDDIQHDFYRPASYHRLSAGLDKQGWPICWSHRILSTSINAYYEPGTSNTQEQETHGADDIHYAVPNIRVEYAHVSSSVPRGWWRSVEHSHNAFVVESFIDELAAAAGKDPLEFRIHLLGESRDIPNANPALAMNTGRLKAALQLAASKSGWGKPMPKGSGRGIAAHYSFRSYIAHVAEISVAKDGRARVDRVVCAVDCGAVINPDTVAAQMEGAIIFGLSAALKGAITIDRGRVQQRNFQDYRVLRINEAPQIEVLIIPSKEPFGGIGEPGVPVIAPAVTNAIFAATGKRIRQLPIAATDLRPG